MLISFAVERVHRYSSICIPNYTTRTRDLAPNSTKTSSIFLPVSPSPRFILNLAKIGELWLKQAVLYTRYVYVNAIGCTWNLLLLGIRKRCRRFGIPLVPVSAERGYHVKASRRNWILRSHSLFRKHEVARD